MWRILFSSAWQAVHQSYNIVTAGIEGEGDGQGLGIEGELGMRVRD